MVSRVAKNLLHVCVANQLLVRSRTKLLLRRADVSIPMRQDVVVPLATHDSGSAMPAGCCSLPQTLALALAPVRDLVADNEVTSNSRSGS